LKKEGIQKLLALLSSFEEFILFKGEGRNGIMIGERIVLGRVLIALLVLTVGKAEKRTNAEEEEGRISLGIVKLLFVLVLVLFEAAEVVGKECCWKLAE
jgi:hypothetical protein